jgi:4-hydroxyphenylacetate 3-monooxygenase/anthranilate 3-monooxygenase (FAD)/4-hydroxyphenylacetate 3-monooxygenase
MIGTAVPISDEILVFPLPKLEAGDEPYTVCFAIPVATKGLRLVCRETLHRADTVGFDHPLSSRFDELDALCIFDDVLVPWDRVFFYGSVEAANNLYDATYARHFTAYQGSLRAFARLKLIVGIAIELAETSGSDGFIHVQEMLGELLGDLELIDGAISLGAGSGSLSTRGAFIPKIEPLLALRYQLPRITARAHEVVMILGGGSLLGSPTLHDVDGPVWHEMERYFAGNGAMEPRSRIGLLKLAWDAVGEGFGQRQLQFERYNAGDPVRIAGSLYRGYNTDELRRTVDRALADPSQRTVAPES